MANRVYLITEQDVHAYIDGELYGDRRRALENFLAERDLPLERAARYLRNNFDLCAVKEEIYKDAALKADIDRLLAKRRRGKGGDA